MPQEAITFDVCDLLKGTGGENGVIALGIIETGERVVRVAERRFTDGEKEYAEYVKPVSELRSEIDSGFLKETGRTAESVNAIRETLRLE